MISKVSVWLAALLLATAGAASSGTLEDMVKDLQPLAGYVVLPVQDEYLIDLDAARGVVEGDLFSVVVPGEKITHPVTGKVLGTLDASKGILQVSQVKGGFSHTRAVSAKGDIRRGDAIRRYDGLRTQFRDYTGRAEGFYSALKSALPALDWQDFAAVQDQKPAPPTAAGSTAADLYIVAANDGITVRDQNYNVVRSYPPPAGMAAAPAAALPVAAAAPYHLEAPAKPAASPYGVQYDVSMPGFQTLGGLGFAAVMSDFVTTGGEHVMAATDGTVIKLFRAGDTLVPLGEVQPSHMPQVLALGWWQPADGNTYLAVSAWKDNGLSSLVYRYENRTLVPVGGVLPYALGSFDRDGDGSRELLLAQVFDREMFWGTVVRELQFKGGEFSPVAPGFKLPRRFTVIGSLMADLDGDRNPETVFTRDGLMYVYSGEKQRYRSPKMMGGSVSRIMFEEQPNARETKTHFAAFEVPPLAVDLDGDGSRELLSVASESSFMSAPGISANIGKSWLAVVKYRDGMFVKGTLGEELDVPLQGLALDQKRVLIVATQPGSVFGKGGDSQLLVFPLNR
ncbi:hypothetical protein [Syntrophotalea acetylenica]|uniref:FG-GAP repeat protein n=1 Tax=Syntrophotalea acetylenica TaxID=29542 RepID=A0A1L3GFT4_SYNAC|nr:hypothetical protein [Syntrophotalea acetylenica]APG24806.1 hypothetical protein A7E75_07035 [Syntrophotalea acetylenica]MDY0263100.1 hypothetical protein [Syntrophotalea acetylenica]